MKMFRKFSTIDHNYSCSDEATFFKNFFSELVVGEEFRYAFFSFDFNEVRQLAAKNGVVIEYCQPGTDAYKQTGGAAAKVVGIVE